MKVFFVFICSDLIINLLVFGKVRVRSIEEIDPLQPDLRAVMIELLKEIERQREESITRTIFEEFAKRTEENFNRVWSSIAELTEAQKAA